MPTKVKYINQSDPANLAHATEKLLNEPGNEYIDFIPLGPGTGLVVFRCPGEVDRSAEVRDPAKGI